MTARRTSIWMLIPTVLMLLWTLPTAPARAAGLDQAMTNLAQAMIAGAELAQGAKNLAVVQFAPVFGEPLKLGDHLMRKVRIQMFELDRQRKLRFVSQGLVLDMIVKQGLQQQSVIFDETQRLKLGQLLTADMLVYGTYERLGDGQAELVGFLVDVKSGVTLAQSVQRADGVAPHLLSPLAAPAAAASYARIGGAALPSDPEAAKRLRMAEIFEERKRPERARELLTGIVQEFPQSLESVLAQLRMMKVDLGQLREDRVYSEDLYQVVATLPPRYKQLSIYGELRESTVDWLVDLARYEYSGGGQESLALDYYEKAKALGLPADQARELEEASRALRVRTAIRQGSRAQAELMLVEWEVEQPDSALRKLVQKEFERPKGMVTVPGTSVDGSWVDAINVDIYETTNAEFLEFVQANPEYRKSRMTHDRSDSDYLQRWNSDLSVDDSLRNVPVVFVSAVVAGAYCKWRKKRLPTSQEWSLAAGEGRRKYPWGDNPPTRETANFNKGVLGDPTPGDSHPQGATPEGVMHMGGNVWESTSSREGHQSVARGGSYYDGATILENRNRQLTTDLPTYSSRFLGIRCVR